MMKKILVALAAVFVLSACSAKEPTPAPTPAEPAVSAPAAAPAPEEKPVTELPIELAPQEQPAEDPAEPVEYSIILIEGLSGDAVGYSLQCPEFGQTEIDTFYTELTQQMESHASGTVHDNCLERHCMANVYGQVTAAVQEAGVLTVRYEYRVEYSDAEEPEVSQRTDRFQLDTGERIKE